MHAGHDHLPPFPRFKYHPAADGVGGILPAVVHYLAEVYAEHGGIVPANGLGVGSAGLVVPVTAIPEIVVMPEHPSIVRNLPEIGQQRLGLGGGVLVHYAQSAAQ